MELGNGNASNALEISRPAAMHTLADEILLKSRSFIVMANDVSEAGGVGSVQLSNPSKMEGENGWSVALPQQVGEG